MILIFMIYLWIIIRIRDKCHSNKSMNLIILSIILMEKTYTEIASLPWPWNKNATLMICRASSTILVTRKTLYSTHI